MDVKLLLRHIQGAIGGRIYTSHWTVYGWEKEKNHYYSYTHSPTNLERLQVGISESDKEIIGSTFPFGLNYANVRYANNSGYYH